MPKILVTDDAAFVRSKIRKFLESEGFEVLEAENGQQALDVVGREPFDVVLMDVQMPELDGLETTRRIRAKWPNRGLHIVAMTANAMAGDRDACLAIFDSNCPTFVAPVERADFEAIIRAGRVEARL